MALKFEFVQDGEFNDPYYAVHNSGGYWIASMIFNGKEWVCETYSNRRLTSSLMIIIANNIEELNESLKQQRILGVF